MYFVREGLVIFQLTCDMPTTCLSGWSTARDEAESSSTELRTVSAQGGTDKTTTYLRKLVPSSHSVLDFSIGRYREKLGKGRQGGC
jgi:hypothetical protein